MDKARSIDHDAFFVPIQIYILHHSLRFLNLSKCISLDCFMYINQGGEYVKNYRELSVFGTDWFVLRV